MGAIKKLKEECKTFVDNAKTLEWEYARVWIEKDKDMDLEELRTREHFLWKEWDQVYEHFIYPFYEEYGYDLEDDDIYEIIEECIFDEVYKQDKCICIIL